MTARLDVQTRDGLMLLTIDNLPQRNALIPDISRAATAALRLAATDPAVRAAVLSGAGEHFCSGGNLASLREFQDKPRAAVVERIGVLNELVRSMRQFPKPLIAAVEGAAAGAGFSLALACDLIVAARDARFSMAYVKIGVSPDGAPTLLLPRALPLQLASELLMEGAPIGAERLYQLGVVNRIVEPGQALAEAQAWAQKLAQGATGAIGNIKRLINQSACPELASHLELERDSFSDLLHAPEAREGFAAFLEKRPANFPK
ncbi:MAG: enoyl-CoA hydratase family protein [Proteobacteria bacterium]|nr:enoyl-CoA hydratase family protein [Pseudomonadota bacterium]